MTKASVAPDMSTYLALRNLPYDINSAIAEYIDNSIQSYLDYPDKDKLLTVIIHWYTKDFPDPKLKNSIVVSDDSVGMTESELINGALKPGKKVDFEYVDGSLNQFGMGLKSASVWLSSTWRLDTVSRIENKAHSMTFDLTDLLKKGNDEVDILSSEVENKNFGTKISVYNILRQDITEKLVSSINEKLKNTYQLFTNESNDNFDKIMNLKAIINNVDEVNLDFDKTYLVPMNFEKVIKSKSKSRKGKHDKIRGTKKIWNESIDFLFADKKVTGFLAVSKVMNTDKCGVLFFKNKKLIINSQDNSDLQIAGAPNKHGNKRFFGQIHLNDFPISMTKDKFNFDMTEFAIKLKNQPGVTDLITQAENYRKTNLAEIDDLAIQNSSNSNDSHTQTNANSGDTQKDNGSSSSTVSSSGEKKDQVNQQEPKDPMKRTALLSEPLPIPDSYKKACLLHKDLRMIDVNEHSVAVALLLRTFVELTVRIYLGNDKPGSELKNMLKNIIEKNTDKLELESCSLISAQNTFKDHVFTQNLNAATHNTEFVMSADRLKTDWDNISTLMERLWTIIGQR